MKFSIIVPIYNSEKYLIECLDSLINQTYKDFELLLIDDGSQDNSLSICRDYESKDSRIKVIYKENGGVSSARNVGIENAHGERILFVDSDDSIDKNALDILNCYQKELIAFNAYSQKNEEVKIDQKTLEYDFFCGKLMDKLLFSSWNKVFNLKVIRKFNIRFDEKVRIGEDMLFTYDYLKHIYDVDVINNKLYHYNIRHDSCMNNLEKDYLCDYLITLESLKKRIGNNRNVLSSWCVDVCAILFVRKLFSTMKFSEFKKYMKKFERSDLRNYMILCKDKKSFSKNMMKFLIKHKMYWILQKGIRFKANKLIAIGKENV